MDLFVGIQFCDFIIHAKYVFHFKKNTPFNQLNCVKMTSGLPLLNEQIVLIRITRSIAVAVIANHSALSGTAVGQHANHGYSRVQTWTF